jgi:hypothetical protein
MDANKIDSRFKAVIKGVIYRFMPSEVIKISSTAVINTMLITILNNTYSNI